MKAFTANLMYFSISFFLGAITFRYGMSYSLESKYFDLVWILATIYFFFNFLIGWHFGKKDYESIPHNDVGFRFHFVTYFLFNSISILWFSLGLNSNYESLRIVYLTAIFWGIILIIHFIFFLLERRKSINGLSKEDLFE
jgi:hypothetical protein